MDQRTAALAELDYEDALASRANEIYKPQWVTYAEVLYQLGQRSQTIAELAENLSISTKVARRMLQALMWVDAVGRTRDGRSHRYWIKAPASMIIVHGFYSVCLNCNRQVLPNAKTHDQVSGYSSIKNPQPGCGIRFTHVSAGGEELRPDLIPFGHHPSVSIGRQVP